ncbi:MAG: pyridoxamine 5'-phosphate oxidase family protein, partial [Gammaproteobacteria bacterium]
NTQTLFHTPVVSTMYENKIVSRVMVLREFNFDKKILRFHTDNRAAKIDNLTKNPSSTVIGYDADLKIQIKMQGQAKVHIDDEVAKIAWNESTPRSKKCYSVKGGSSKKIENPGDYDITNFEVEDGYQNFAVIIFNFLSLEFLYLKSSGHRRALHDWYDDYSSTWLVP